MLLLKEFFEKVHFEKKSANSKKKNMQNYPVCKSQKPKPTIESYTCLIDSTKNQKISVVLVPYSPETVVPSILLLALSIALVLFCDLGLSCDFALA